jgi:anion-transporting  ArsA/GET3 family ATPase
MKLSSLLDRRLVFVSGKGGVGKTTVSLVLATIAARLKKRVLLVEMNSSGRIPLYFGAESAGHDELPLAPYLTAINILPKKCFEEYVLERVRFRALYETIFNNKYVTNFLGATPGLSEILMLGKIAQLEKKTKGRLLGEPCYDLVIVDAPATGHGLSVLEVPKVLESAVKLGPLHAHAVEILALLGDAQKTAFALVTLAEEMPVAESREYIHALREKTHLHFGPIFINAVMPPVGRVKTHVTLSGGLSLYVDYHHLACERAALNQHYIQEIETSFADFDKLILPFSFENLVSAKEIGVLADSLTKESGA